MEEAKEFIEKADVIFLHAPGLNKNMLLRESQALNACASKVRSIEFKTKKANFTEAEELAKKICEIKIVSNTQQQKA